MIRSPLELLAAVSGARQRSSALTELVAWLDVDDIIVLIRDPELGCMIPAPGLRATISGGPRWLELLRSTHAPGVYDRELEAPQSGQLVPATVHVLDSDLIVAFLGPRGDHGRIAELAPALPMLGAVLLTEHGKNILETKLAIEGDAASRAVTLAANLDEALADGRRVDEALHRAQVELQRHVVDLTARGHITALGAAVGAALISKEDSAVKLRRCAEAVVEHLGAAFARIWTLDEHSQVLVLEASAGMYTHLDGGHSRVPLGALKIGRIASERRPYLTNTVADDPATGDQAWARREGLTAFAGYPLHVGDRLLGVLALFSRTPLSDVALVALGSIADQLALGIDRDRAELERIERDRFRTLFVGMLGHDLRNPLSAIATATEAMLIRARGSAEAGTEAERAIKNLDRIKRSSQRMARMIDQILEFARLQAGGGIPVDRQPAEMIDACRQAVDELESTSSGRAIEVRHCGDSRGDWDMDRLSQVFSNLIGNALTYGEPGCPVSVVVDGTGREVAVTVHNFGPPIPASDLPTLFDAFRRSGQQETGRPKGLGLGLYITHQIVLAHGGRLDVTSSADNGTTFAFWLPRHTALRDRHSPDGAIAMLADHPYNR